MAYTLISGRDASGRPRGRSSAGQKRRLLPRDAADPMR